jgi:hypothetical protein
MPINITQESYDKIKAIPPPQRRVKRPRLDKSVTSGGDSDQENMLENVEVTNLDPPSGDKRPMVLFSHVMKQSELAKVSCLINCIISSIICSVSNISIGLYTVALHKDIMILYRFVTVLNQPHTCFCSVIVLSLLAFKFSITQKSEHAEYK